MCFCPCFIDGYEGDFVAGAELAEFRLRADQADTGSGGVVMYFPRGGEEGGDVFFGEEIRCGMRAVEHADFPGV